MSTTEQIHRADEGECGAGAGRVLPSRVVDESWQSHRMGDPDCPYPAGPPPEYYPAMLAIHAAVEQALAADWTPEDIAKEAQQVSGFRPPRVEGFGTVQIGPEPVTHLEHHPAGVTLCGLDLFPDVPADQRPGFCRGGGVSTSEEPCPECLRRVKRYTGSCEVRIGGSCGSKQYRAALDGGSPA